MRTGFRHAILATVATNFLLPAIAAATEPQIELHRNPFARPAVEELITNTARVKERPAEQAPGLRAVLVAGSKSVVNIGGVILQIGECTDAFCLLSVEEGKALISRNDKEIVLSLYEQDMSEER
jgi:hypothetical protein